MGKVFGRKFAFLAVASASFALSACSTTQTSRPVPHYLGFSETITQNDKQVFADASLSDSVDFSAKATVLRGHKSSQAFTSKIELANFKRAIIRREIPTEGFESAFGHETEFVFSVQMCGNIEIKGDLVVCADKSPAPADVVRKRINLIKGQQVAADFPNGIVWTFNVLDQASPIAPN